MIAAMTNPLFLFAAVWSTAVTLYLAGVSAGTFPSPHPLTIAVLLLNAVAFFLGYSTWTLFQGLTPQPIDPPGAYGRPATPQRIQQALTLSLLAGVIALLLMLYRATVIAAQFDIGLLDLLMQPTLLRLGLIISFEASISHTNLMVQMISLTSGLFAVGFVLLGVFLHIDTTVRRYVFLCGFLAIELAACLMNLSRYDMTVHVMYLILSYFVVGALARGGQFRRATGALLLPLLTVAAVFIIVELLLRKGETYGHTGRLQGVLYSFYWYMASPIAALNEFLVNFRGGYDLGQNTFLPFAKWLYQFHLLPEPDMSIYGDYVFVPYPANVYTYLRAFYLDFGIWGVAVVPYVLGWLIAAIRGSAGRYVPFLYLYVTLLVPLIFSFFNYSLLSSQFYLQILFAFLFFRYEFQGGRRIDAVVPSGCAT